MLGICDAMCIPTPISCHDESKCVQHLSHCLKFLSHLLPSLFWLSLQAYYYVLHVCMSNLCLNCAWAFFCIESWRLHHCNSLANNCRFLTKVILQTSNTLSWALYCLATNPEAQEKLRSEVMAVVGSDELVTPEHIAKMPYLHGCIKETQRWSLCWHK